MSEPVVGRTYFDRDNRERRFNRHMVVSFVGQTFVVGMVYKNGLSPHLTRIRRARFESAWEAR